MSRPADLIPCHRPAVGLVREWVETLSGVGAALLVVVLGRSPYRCISSRLITGIGAGDEESGEAELVDDVGGVVPCCRWGRSP